MSSNGQREKRSAKRRERRRPAGPPDGASAPIPTDDLPRRKISETLKAFAQPLLSRLPAEAETAQGWREPLALAVLVWNGVVCGDSRRAILAKASRSSLRDDLTDVVAELIERKEKLFSDDQRCILGFDTYERGDRIHIVALSVC